MPSPEAPGMDPLRPDVYKRQSQYSTKNKKGDLGSPYGVSNFFKLDPNLKDPMTGDEPVSYTHLVLIITFLLLVFLQSLIGIAADLFVRTVVKPSLNPTPLVLRTSFSPMPVSYTHLC